MPIFKELSADQAHHSEAWRQKHVTWGAPFNMKQWEEFAEQMQSIVIKHGMKTNVFGVLEGDVLVAACEVLERPLYIGGGKTTTDYGVATVHTAADHRRKGYANTLIEGILNKYKSDEQIQLSLWSDVGDYYARMGFKMLPGDGHFMLSVAAAPSTDSVSEVELIDSPEKLKVCQEAHNKLLTELVDTTGGQAVLATAGIYELATARSTIYKSLLGEPEPKVFGARNGTSWLTWSYQYGQSRILILGGEGSPEQLAQLLKVSASVAANECLDKVEVYATTFINVNVEEIRSSLESLGLMAEIYKREKNLPMTIGKKEWVGAGGYAWY